MKLNATFLKEADNGRDQAVARIDPIDPQVGETERPRLRGQNGQIVARLRRGPATNADLAMISLKYTSRISDCRAAGYDIQIVRRDPGGRNWYELIE